MAGERGERPLFEELLDYAVYAPLGAALTLADELPRLVERGRARLAGRVSTASFIGRAVVATGRRRVEEVLAGRPPVRGPRRPAPADRAGAPEAGSAGQPSARDLAIPGYDTLAASQVVARLAGLSREELEAVRRYEASTRQRRTILTRIEQLTGEVAHGTS
jgi:hypothetical protein